MTKRLQSLLGLLILALTAYLAVTKDYSEIFLGILFVVAGHLISSSLLASTLTAIAGAIKQVLGAKKDSE